MFSTETLELIAELDPASQKDLERLVVKYCKAVIDLMADKPPMHRDMYAARDEERRNAMEEFRLQMIDLRIKKGATRADMAKALGVSWTTINLLEKKTRKARLSPETLAKLMRYSEILGAPEEGKAFMERYMAIK